MYRGGRHLKRINRKKFEEAVDAVINHGCTITKGSKMCGVSNGTFVTRVTQYLEGNLPEDAFLPDELPDLSNYE